MTKAIANSTKAKSIDKPEYEIVCRLLRAIRQRAKLSQGSLGEALGRPQTFVSDCELGARRLDALQLREWCQACGTSFADFARRLDETLEVLPPLAPLASKSKPKKAPSKS